MNDWEKQTAVRVTEARRALESGQLRVPPEMPGVKELLAAPTTPFGLVDISKLSDSAIGLGRMAGMAAAAHRELSSPPEQPSSPMDPHHAQCELFRLFSLLFASLTGVDASLVKEYDEVRARLVARATNEYSSVAKSFNAAAAELEDFYRQRSQEIFRYAQDLGGMKVVTGGQRKFTGASLDATRISGLYTDTQLIPDPVLPFLAGNLELNAMHLQLAHVLYYVLQLRPLVDARLDVPPVVVFPSFEEPLEEHDSATKAGIESLLLQVVSPVCEGSIGAVGELFDYAQKQQDKFLQATMSAQLFVPQGHEPGDFKDAHEALKSHISSVEGIHSKKMVQALKAAPPGVAVLHVIAARLRPQFHLLENAEEMQAQPLMALPVQWHYFSLCAQASARDLVNRRILSEASFVTLRALQDDSVSWLADIPIAELLEMRRNMEVANFREELKKYTSQLQAAGPAELDAVVKEVNHGLASLIQQHAKGMEDVRSKYWPKIVGAAAGAAVGAVGLGSLAFLPSLAAAATVVAPAGAVLGALGGGALEAVKEFAGRKVEQRQLARHSLLGILAAARAKGSGA